MRRWTWIVIGLALGSTVASAGEFSGRWRVARGDDVDARRSLVERKGELSLIGPPDVPGLAGRVLRGPYLGERAELDAVAKRGAVQALLDQEAEGPAARVSLKLRQRGREKQVVARYLYGGRLVTQELWVLEREPLIEVLEVSHPSDYDPKEHGALRVRYALRGSERRAVRLRVELPDEGGARYLFYRDALGGGSAPLSVATYELGTVAPGEHTAELDGRDQTPAARILLGGDYRLVAELPDVEEELGRDEGQVSFAQPRAEHLAPQWLLRPRADAKGKVTWRESPDAARIQRELGRGLTQLGGRTPGIQTRLSPEDFSHRLARAADVVIKTHGYRGGVATYLPQTAWELLEEPAHARAVNEATLSRSLPRGDELRDLHVVVVWACLTGGGGFPDALIQRGADVVVAFDQSIAQRQSSPYFTRLFADLSGRGEAADPPAQAVRSWGWAAREAAVFADEWFHEALKYDAQLQAKWKDRLHDSIVIRTAAGIDADSEKGYPIRYGNSKN